MDKYLQADLRLAQLLHPDNQYRAEKDLLLLIDPEIGPMQVIRWSQNPGAAFALLLEHTEGYYETGSRQGPCIVIGNKTPGVEATVEYLKDHDDDKTTALRFAAVQSVIATLEAKKQLALRSQGWRPHEISADTLLSRNLLTQLGNLHALYAKFEEGHEKYPWKSILPEIDKMLDAYRESTAVRMKFFPDTKSKNPTEQLIAQLNRFSTYWLSYNPHGKSQTSYITIKEELVETLNTFDTLRNSPEFTKTKPTSGMSL